jgi:hypothetical protein
MLTLPVLLKGKRKLRALPGASIIRSGLILPGFILLLFTGSYLKSSAQANNIRTDIVSRISPNNLRPPQQRQNTEYRNSVKNNLTVSARPYDPYIPVNFNPRYLPPPPVRVYLGKRTDKDADDYLLLVVRCKIVDSTINRGEVLHYTDDTVSQGPGKQPGGGAVWTAISVRRRSSGRGTSDTVNYATVTTKDAQQYINNFQTVVEKKESYRRYPVCFVISKKKRNVERIKLQPVIAARSKGSSGSTGQQRVSLFREAIFQFGDTYQFQDADGNGDLCCKSPPETGSSVKPRD